MVFWVNFVEVVRMVRAWKWLGERVSKGGASWRHEGGFSHGRPGRVDSDCILGKVLRLFHHTFGTHPEQPLPTDYKGIPFIAG